jgi:hypothetical protein
VTPTPRRRILPAILTLALLSALAGAALTASASATAPGLGAARSNAYLPLVQLPQAGPDEITEAPPEQIIWSDDLESGDFSGWFTQDQNGGIYNTGSGTATVSGEVARSGRYAARLAISGADGGSGNQAVRIFRWAESRSEPEAYYSVWLYFPQRYQPSAWWNVLQFKSVNAERNDPFWILNVGNRDDGAMFFYLYNWVNQRGHSQSVRDIPVAQWVHVEVYYKQSAEGQGRITVWQDGVELFDIEGITTGFPGALEPSNWSVNNYTDAITPSNAVIYVDDPTISKTRVGP